MTVCHWCSGAQAWCCWHSHVKCHLGQVAKKILLYPLYVLLIGLQSRSPISPGEKTGPEALVQSLSSSGFGGQAAGREDLTSTGVVQKHPITSLLVA